VEVDQMDDDREEREGERDEEKGLEEAHGLRLEAVLPVAGFAAGVSEG
jgi:hypothetical protein